jgi:cysteinyl-tRNA synthetase
VDLVFPHHENEIAQSRCACGGHFARHWFHVTHLLVDGAKMSKSLGNMYTLDQLQEMGYTPAALRYVLAGAYYRRPLNFTLTGMKDATSALNKLGRFDKELAKASGVTQQAISAIESGKNKFPRVITLYQLARALRCTVDDLIDDDPLRKAE